MDKKTGVTLEGTNEALKEIEKDLKRELVPLEPYQVEEVRALPGNQRRAYAKKLALRRAKAKNRKKANRIRRRKNK